MSLICKLGLHTWRKTGETELSSEEQEETGGSLWWGAQEGPPYVRTRTRRIVAIRQVCQRCGQSRQFTETQETCETTE